MSRAPGVRRPADADEAARLLREAADPPLLTGSAPTDLSSLPDPAARAIGEGERVVLSTESLSGVTAHRPEDLTVTAAAGTRIGALRERLRGQGQWLPVSAGDSGRSVGGLVAAAPAGPYADGYGPVRRHVLAVRVVTYDGETLDWGRGVVKDVAGYDVKRLACGSRGRLGMLARVTFRVWPLPERRRRFALADPESDGCSAGATVGVEADDDWRPDAEVWRWPAAGDGRAALFVELAGSEESVDARERRLRRWTRNRGLEAERVDSGDASAGLPTGGAEGGGRPPGAAALRFRVEPRYVGRATAAARDAGGADRVSALPRRGVVTASFRSGDAGLAALEAVSDAAPGAAAQVERGGPELHDAVTSRRDRVRVRLERRVLDALGGRRRAWAADFV